MIKKNIFIYPYLFFSILFSAETVSDRHLNSIDVENKLGQKVSSDIQILSDKNELMYLDNIFHQGAPIVLVMAYYQCPMLCSLVLNGLSKALVETDLIPGDDYSLLTVSIDPDEGPSLSKEKKANYINNYFKNVEAYLILRFAGLFYYYLL